MTRLLAAALRPQRLTGQVARQVGKLLLPECLPAGDLVGAAKAVLLELGDCFLRSLGDEGDGEPRLARQDVETRRLLRLIGAIAELNCFQPALAFVLLHERRKEALD